MTTRSQPRSTGRLATSATAERYRPPSSRCAGTRSRETAAGRHVRDRHLALGSTPGGPAAGDLPSRRGRNSAATLDNT